jgi:hypothetical protein
MTELFYENVGVGTEISPAIKGPISTMHLMRWSSAIENWHRIHYDQPFATKHDGLPDVLVNGSWKQHILAQMLKDFAGPNGWVRRITFAYRGMDAKGATVIAFGRVEGKREFGEWGVLDCSVGMRNDSGDITTTGTAEVILPRLGGPSVPYPVTDEALHP